MEDEKSAKSKANASGTKELNQASDPAFRQILNQQVTEAIRPVLEEWRQQMTQELGQRATAEAATGADEQRASPQKPESPAAQAERELPANAAGAQSAVTETLRPGLEAIEQQTISALQSSLAALVTALLADTTRSVIQQQAEAGLHAFVQKLFATLQDGANNQQMQDKTERLLQAILREFLDAVFAETIRVTAQQESQQAIQASFHGDFGGIMKSGRDILKTLVEALIAVARRNQQNLMRLALALALLALAGSISRSASNKSAH